jgi:aerobic-type carbon monoxide dehydrogenase small subunit (CoxS/CutS family)
MKLAFTLNDTPVTLQDVPPSATLLDVLRDHLKLTGTRLTCGRIRTASVSNADTVSSAQSRHHQHPLGLSRYVCRFAPFPRAGR